MVRSVRVLRPALPPLGETALHLIQSFDAKFKQIDADDLKEYEEYRLVSEYGLHGSTAILQPLQEKLYEFASSHPSFRVEGGEDDEVVSSLNPQRREVKHTAYARLRLVMSQVGELIAPIIRDIETTRNQLNRVVETDARVFMWMEHVLTFKSLSRAMPFPSSDDEARRARERADMRSSVYSWFKSTDIVQPTYEYDPRSVRTLFKETLDDLTYIKLHMPKPKWITRRAWETQFVIQNNDDAKLFIGMVSRLWNEKLDVPDRCAKLTYELFDFSDFPVAVLRTATDTIGGDKSIVEYFDHLKLLIDGSRVKSARVNPASMAGVSQVMPWGVRVQMRIDAREEERQNSPEVRGLKVIEELKVKHLKDQDAANRNNRAQQTAVNQEQLAMVPFRDLNQPQRTARLFRYGAYERMRSAAPKIFVSVCVIALAVHYYGDFPMAMWTEDVSAITNGTCSMEGMPKWQVSEWAVPEWMKPGKVYHIAKELGAKAIDMVSWDMVNSIKATSSWSLDVLKTSAVRVLNMLNDTTPVSEYVDVKKIMFNSASGLVNILAASCVLVYQYGTWIYENLGKMIFLVGIVRQLFAYAKSYLVETAKVTKKKVTENRRRSKNKFRRHIRPVTPDAVPYTANRKNSAYENIREFVSAINRNRTISGLLSMALVLFYHAFRDGWLRDNKLHNSMNYLYKLYYGEDMGFMMSMFTQGAVVSMMPSAVTGVVTGGGVVAGGLFMQFVANVVTVGVGMTNVAMRFAPGPRGLAT
jgi:hypothetical protein